MMYKTPPENFNPRFEVACCHVDCDGKFLMLHRADHKSAGDKWGVPAGKVDPGETPLETAQRETKEETGIDIPTQDIHFRNTVYVRYPDYDFIYHIFQAEVESMENIVIHNKEHKNFRWMTPIESLALGDALVPDEGACIELIYHIETEKPEYTRNIFPLK